ncbi:MAG: hypothetical protein ACP5O5_07075 [Fervidicoccaceae archaeon]
MNAKPSYYIYKEKLLSLIISKWVYTSIFFEKGLFIRINVRGSREAFGFQNME